MSEGLGASGEVYVVVDVLDSLKWVKLSSDEKLEPEKKEFEPEKEEFEPKEEKKEPELYDQKELEEQDGRS